MKFFVWTVNTPEDVKRAKELGVDGIITDFPELI
ncbi:MAG: glycerophosphodiester phosphodiesterase family protein [Candidatus Magasanikbacteria bacterium]|nr:glycerophosphodiester phosphodiesterase family protein [Candidatus Magasanikbacteria bacterium]